MADSEVERLPRYDEEEDMFFFERLKDETVSSFVEAAALITPHDTGAAESDSSALLPTEKVGQNGKEQS